MIQEEKTTTKETAKDIIGTLANTQLAKATQLAQAPVLKIKNSQIVAGIVGTTGFIIFALGIENIINQINLVSSPYIEIVIGLIMLSVSGLLLKKLN